MELLQKLKRLSLETFLSYGTAILVCDSHVRNLVIPEIFRDQGRVIFHIGYNTPTPIPDLEVTDKGVSTTLSFPEGPFKVFVPWEAVVNTGLMGTACVCRFARTVAEFEGGEQPGEQPEEETTKPNVPEQQGKVIPFGIINGDKND